MSTKLKFRAECAHDVDEFIKHCPEGLIASIKRNRLVLHGHTMPDEEVELELGTAFTLAHVKRAMREVEDGHVMLQTVEMADAYTGERDYERR